MNVDDRTAPILDPAQVAELRRSAPPVRAAEPVVEPTAPGGTGLWLGLVVVGNLLVLVMLVLVVLWS